MSAMWLSVMSLFRCVALCRIYQVYPYDVYQNSRDYDDDDDDDRDNNNGVWGMLV